MQLILHNLVICRDRAKKSDKKPDKLAQGAPHPRRRKYSPRLHNPALHERNFLGDNSELRRRAADLAGTTAPLRASPPKGGGCARSGGWGGNGTPSSAIAATNFTSGWAAGKVLTAGGGHGGGISHGSNRSPSGQSGTDHRVAAGVQQPATGGAVDACGYSGHGVQGTGRENGVATGRRVRSGATWGLVGGWGDSFHAYGTAQDKVAGTGNSADGSDRGNGNGDIRGNSANMISSGNDNDDSNNHLVERHVAIESPRTSCGYDFGHQFVRGGGNPKNESATAPWAAVQAAGVNIFAGHAGYTAKGAASTWNIADVEGESFFKPCVAVALPFVTMRKTISRSFVLPNTRLRAYDYMLLSRK